MDNDKLIALIQAVSASDLMSFSLKDGNFKLSMDKSDGGIKTVGTSANAGESTCAAWETAPKQVQIMQAGPEAVISAPTPEVVQAPVVPAIDDASVKEVKSPIVGTFYSAPGADKDDFVKVGDRVKAGQTLCVVEAMKLMNDIESDFDGEIVEILAKNEAMVEFNQPLFRIKVI